MKKIAIAAENNSLQSALAIRAGRCKWFCILDEDGNMDFVENPGNSVRAAFGFHAFNYLKEIGIDTVIARFFGPRFQELSRTHGINLIVPPTNVKMISEIIDNLNTSKK